MVKVLMSINPLHAEKILSGTKKYEFRKIRCKKPIDTIVIYVTAPIYILDDEFETTFKEGIDWLYQGMPSYEKCGLTKEEIDVFEALLKKLQIIY